MRRLLAAPVLVLALASCGSSSSHGTSLKAVAASPSASDVVGESASCASPATDGSPCVDTTVASPPVDTPTAAPGSSVTAVPPSSPVNPPCCKSTVVPSKAGRTTKGSGGSGGSSGSTTASPPITGGGTDSHVGQSCDPDVLTMTVTATSSGHNASFTAVLTNTGPTTCTVTEGAGTPDFTVSGSGGQVWAQSCDGSTSGHTGPLPCPDYARLQDLAPGGTQRFTQDWDGTADGNPVKPAPDGSYTVSAFVSGASGKAGFSLS